jgi:hypothetical protein
MDIYDAPSSLLHGEGRHLQSLSESEKFQDKQLAVFNIVSDVADAEMDIRTLSGDPLGI